MAFPAGTHVVERDHAVLAALAIARYLRGDQVATLVFPGLDERVARRRLNRLAERGASKLDPLVRGVAYRSASGAPMKAWALTEAGHVLAKQLVPYAPSPQKDVGPAFLEHTLLLNDVFVGLAAAALRRDARDGLALLDLPFRWLAESGEYVRFEHYDRGARGIERTRIRPDATLEIGEPRRRVFLECETGAHTLVSSDPTSTGATNAKIQRYTHLLAGVVRQHDSTTPYAALCPDRLPAVLVFLAHSGRRRDAIRKLVTDPERPARIPVRAFTFAEAADVLGALAGGRATAPSSPVASITVGELDLLARALGAVRPASPDGRETRNRVLADASKLIARLRASARVDSAAPFKKPTPGEPPRDVSSR
jgi:hypothetical protein